LSNTAVQLGGKGGFGGKPDAKLDGRIGAEKVRGDSVGSSGIKFLVELIAATENRDEPEMGGFVLSPAWLYIGRLAFKGGGMYRW
jgi:hypothetical protein